jgi:enoyl-CoA hydratase/carnithine racemase
MHDEPVYLTRHDAVASLVLNRPAKHNALTEAMWREISELLAEAEADSDIQVLIVRGKGGAFAAGADISEFEDVYATPERAEAYSRAIGDALDGLARFPKPTIASIEGACVGGGCALALACDLRFAAQGARFGVTPARLGLVYPFNDTRRLVNAVGSAAAKDLLFTARLIDAETALQIGLINRLTPSGILKETVNDYASHITRASSHTAKVTKQMIALIEAGQDQDCERTRALFLEAFSGEHFQEGYKAFLDKRHPDFPKP